MRLKLKGVVGYAHPAEPITDLHAREPRPIRRNAPSVEMGAAVGASWGVEDAEDDASAKEESPLVAGHRPRTKSPPYFCVVVRDPDVLGGEMGRGVTRQEDAPPRRPFKRLQVSLHRRRRWNRGESRPHGLTATNR